MLRVEGIFFELLEVAVFDLLHEGFALEKIGAEIGTRRKEISTWAGARARRRGRVAQADQQPTSPKCCSSCSCIGSSHARTIHFHRAGTGARSHPANESAIVVDQPAVALAANADALSSSADQQFALLLPKMTLEIRAALDRSLQKEIAALRGFIGITLDSHAERLQGDLATLLPATRTPELDLPPSCPSAVPGRDLRLVAGGHRCGGRGMHTWLWWNQGGEMAALRTDLSAAYASSKRYAPGPR